MKVNKIFKNLFIILLIFMNGLYSYELSAQITKPKPTRQSSMEAFSKGEYEKAYGEFSELLKTYSKDPLYKYYASVCLVKLERDPEQAITLMQQAIESNTAARPLPADAIFYLARAQHLNGNYSEATGSYNKYSDQAGRKTARDMGVAEYIQQCTQEKGAIGKEEEKPVEEKEEEINPAVEAKTVQVAVTAPVVTPVNSLPEKELLAENYSDMLDEALRFQFLADSVTTLVTEQRKLLETLPNDQRSATRSKIAEYELLAGSYQRSADKKYNEAHIAINPEEHSQDEISQTSEKKTTEIAGNQADTIKEKISVPSDTVEVHYYFKVLDKPVTDPKVRIVIDPPVPEGLIYRIQVAVFRNPVSAVFFKGITPVYGFRNEGSVLKTYYAGLFRRLSDARNALAEVKGKGFKDSFITSFQGKKQVSPDRAAVLEKEWGSKPFERTVNKMPVVVAADTLPPTLVFRVEVMRLTKPVKPDVVESMKTMAGSRGLDIITLADKKIAYLIGNFITFESAAEYADLIMRNGYREARVVAWLGTREVPVDTARQLFENLK